MISHALVVGVRVDVPLATDTISVHYESPECLVRDLERKAATKAISTQPPEQPPESAFSWRSNRDLSRDNNVDTSSKGVPIYVLAQSAANGACTTSHARP